MYAAACRLCQIWVQVKTVPNCVKQWLWETGTASFQGACLIDREFGWEQAGLDLRVWEWVNEHKEEDFRVGAAWVQAHTSAKEKAQMTLQNRQVAVANDKANEIG